jgi:hypothetical protein
MPTILNTSFASLIVCSPIAFAALNALVSRPQQLYADSRNRVPMKILDTLPENWLRPLVACLIRFGDNYTYFSRHGPIEFNKESV